MRRRRGLVVPAGVALVVAALVVAGCGTRLPASAFASQRGSGSAASSRQASGSPGNTASDIGVTPSAVRVGIVASLTSPLGGEAFSGPMYGARAFFDALNARGGVHGRRVQVSVCDDGSSGSGNQSCVHHLIDDTKVFALTATTSLDYAGAPYVEAKGVPDVGGQPVGNAYDQYRHLYSIYGSNEPREGTVGFGGVLYGGTEVYRYFKAKLGARTAGVVYYNQADSQRFASLTMKSLAVEGYRVVPEQVDFALPNFDSAVLDMKARGVDVVFDALDSSGNVDLCRSMDNEALKVKAKVTTVQNWNSSVRTDFAASPVCRNSLYSTGNDRNYSDQRYPAVKAFRTAMHRYLPNRDGKLSMWELEGWAAAQWLTDAMTSCGARLTRGCVERYMNRAQPYDGHGLLTPRSFVVSRHPGRPSRNCLNVARWQDSADGGHGGWVTQVPNMDTNCFVVPDVPYRP
jgi:ABC-type branched-subunit amino acid transport system substrate-binding protein